MSDPGKAPILDIVGAVLAAGDPVYQPRMETAYVEYARAALQAQDEVPFAPDRHLSHQRALAALTEWDRAVEAARVALAGALGQFVQARDACVKTPHGWGRLDHALAWGPTLLLAALVTFALGQMLLEVLCLYLKLNFLELSVARIATLGTHVDDPQVGLDAARVLLLQGLAPDALLRQASWAAYPLVAAVILPPTLLYLMSAGRSA